jgi:hypothetical protein
VFEPRLFCAKYRQSENNDTDVIVLQSGTTKGGEKQSSRSIKIFGAIIIVVDDILVWFTDVLTHLRQEFTASCKKAGQLKHRSKCEHS